MALGRIKFFTMKTLGSYVILVGIFYELLLQLFSFSRNIHLFIDNMIVATHLIVLFLPSIVHTLNFYFEFVNFALVFNSKRQPCRNLLKKYIKRLYWQKIKSEISTH